MLVFLAVFIEFKDKIVLAFSDKNGHVFLLNQFEQGKKEENGMDSVFTGFKDFFERYNIFCAYEVEHIFPAFLEGIVVLDYCMYWSVLSFLNPQNDLFKCLHQFEEADRLYFSSRTLKINS